MKQDEYSTAWLSLNSGAKEIQQLDPGGPDQRQIIKPQPTALKVFRSIIKSEVRRRAIKGGSKVVNRDWANHQACSLSYQLHVVSGSFIRNDYFPESIRKISATNYFSL